MAYFSPMLLMAALTTHAAVRVSCHAPSKSGNVSAPNFRVVFPSSGTFVAAGGSVVPYISYRLCSGSVVDVCPSGLEYIGSLRSLHCSSCDEATPCSCLDGWDGRHTLVSFFPCKSACCSSFLHAIHHARLVELILRLYPRGPQPLFRVTDVAGILFGRIVRR